MDYAPHLIYAIAVLLLAGLVRFLKMGGPGARRATLVFLVIALVGGVASIHVKHWRQLPDTEWQTALDELYEREAARPLVEIRPDGEIVISPEVMRRLREGRGLSEDEIRRLREQIEQNGFDEDDLPPELTP